MVNPPAHPFINSLEHVIGFFVVMITLGILYSLTALIGRYFIKREAARPKAAPAQVAPAGEDMVTDEEVVAITACAALVMGQRSRVVSIRSSAPKDWSREGRREQFASHRIR